MSGANLIFYGTTGPAGTNNNTSQPDPAQWLGKFRATQTLHSLQSTLTHVQTTESRHYLRDTARIGDGANAHAFKWLLILTGPAAMSAARIESFDNATGIFKLDRRTTANAAIGNTYALFNRNNVWPDVTAQQAIEGDTRYRCIFLRNQHGVAITNVRFHVVPLSAGGSDLARCASPQDLQDISGQFLSRPNDTTDILTALGAVDPVDAASFTNSMQGTSGWASPQSRAASGGVNASLANNFGSPVWLRRIISPGWTKRRSVAVMLVVSTDLTGSDPDPLVTGAIMSWDIAGTPAGILELDRYVGERGGCRLNGRVFEASTGLPYREQVRFDLFPGDLGTVVTDELPSYLPGGVEESDDEGKAFATFRADEASAAGAVVTPRMFVAAGEEVGEPKPPLALSFTGGFGFAHAAELFTTTNTQEFQEDPAPGFMPAI